MEGLEYVVFLRHYMKSCMVSVEALFYWKFSDLSELKRKTVRYIEGLISEREYMPFMFSYKPIDGIVD